MFVKAENVNVDLTFDIQNFTDTGEYCLFPLCCNLIIKRNRKCDIIFYYNQEANSSEVYWQFSNMVLVSNAVINRQLGPQYG